MTDQDYIKAAVELADGWTLIDGQYIETGSGYKSTVHSDDEIRDALASQLVRQVDALDYYVVVRRTATEIHTDQFKESMNWRHEHDGRTMNTIKAIVDSKVLK